MSQQLDSSRSSRPISWLRRRLSVNEPSPAAKILMRQEMKIAQESPSKRHCPINPQSYDDHKKLVSDLTKQLKNEIFKRQTLEKQLTVWKQRLVRRQSQFRRIIAQRDSQKHPPSRDTLQTIHNQIQQNIQFSNQDAQRWLQSKFKDNLALMQKRIKQIKAKSDQEIQKHKKLSQDSYNSIMMEIESTKVLAKNIDEENRRLTKQLRDTKFKNSLLVQQRNMLINDVLDKKNSLRAVTTRLDFNISQRIPSSPNKSVHRFMGQPSISSPKQRAEGSTTHRVEKAQKNTIDNLKRSLLREKKKNFELSGHLSENCKKNQQLNRTLWQCINQAKIEVQKLGNTPYALILIQNLAKSEKLMKIVSEMTEMPSQNKMSSALWNIEDLS